MVPPPRKNQGIYPDVMHIVHLALGIDVITSCLLDWSDDERLVPGNSRDKRLEWLWGSYWFWCEGQNLSERCQRKLFTAKGLKPEAGKYLEISQKTLNAMASRYMIFWVASMSNQFAIWTQLDADMYLGFFRTGCLNGLCMFHI